MDKITVSTDLSGVEELLQTWLTREIILYRQIKKRAKNGEYVKMAVEDFKVGLSDIQKVTSAHPLLKSIKDEADKLETTFADDIDIPIYL